MNSINIMFEKCNISKYKEIPNNVTYTISWIGYRYRNSKLDYKKRKHDLLRIEQQNQETFEELRVKSNNLLFVRTKEAFDKQRKDFFKIASNLHHLVSTTTIPGVYNSPYLPEESKPVVFSANVETHLKLNIKNNLKEHVKHGHLHKTFNHMSQGKLDLMSIKARNQSPNKLTK
jgi:hypothetical protein